MPVYAGVVINEIFPKTEDVTREWIELYNTGSESVSLNQWKLENTEGTPKTFVINASGIIASHGYITYYQPQTGIIFNVNGDTVRLTDDHNTLIDSQNYLSTLGYNTSMGRSPDGGSSWTICNSQTPDKPNDCPLATPTQTPTPSPIPTNTPIPVTTEAPAYQPPVPIANSVLGTTIIVTPTSTPPDDLITIPVPNTIAISKQLVVQITVVLGAWSMLAFIAIARRKRKPRR
jgi:hypothetical protein